MRSITLLYMIWSVCCLSSIGCGRAASKGTPDQAQPIDAILKDLAKAERDYLEAVHAATSEEEQKGLGSAYRDRQYETTVRLLSIVRATPEDPAVVDALIWILTKGEGWTDPRDEAFSLLERDHLSDGRLAKLCSALEHRHTFARTSAFFRAALHGSENREVRAFAGCVLALRSRRVAEEVQWFVNASPEQRANKEQNEGFEYAAAYSTKAECERLFTEADALFKQLIEDYGDIPIGPDSMADVARAHLYRHQRLGIGDVAPEIEGEDADGTRFKLSDYRGNVVVLDFWGDW